MSCCQICVTIPQATPCWTQRVRYDLVSSLQRSRSAISMAFQVHSLKVKIECPMLIAED